MTDLFECRIAGIPATLRVTSYSPGTLNPRSVDSDADFNGWLEYEVCDHKGREAKWLKNKLSDEERRTLEIELERAICAGDL